jgi:hypothetical protein
MQVSCIFRASHYCCIAIMTYHNEYVRIREISSITSSLLHSETSFQNWGPNLFLQSVKSKSKLLIAWWGRNFLLLKSKGVDNAAQAAVTVYGLELWGLVEGTLAGIDSHAHIREASAEASKCVAQPKVEGGNVGHRVQTIIVCRMWSMQNQIVQK